MKALVKKKNGDASIIGGMFATVFTLMVIVTAVFAYASWQTQLERSYEIDLVMHKYLVEMETINYSNQAEITALFGALKQELEEHNMSNISFAGSSMEPVESGSRIKLCVSGNIETAIVETNGRLASSELIRGQQTVSITKSGTAMY